MTNAQTTQEALKDLGAWKAAAMAAQVERDALAAQVEVLTDHRRELLDLIYNNAIGAIAMGYAVDIESMAENAFSITGIDAPKNREDEVTSPNCFLAEIRAEAIADAVNAHPEKVAYVEHYAQTNSKGMHCDLWLSSSDLINYANRIRQGGDV